MKRIESLGFVPVVDRGEHKRTGFLAGDDAARASRLSRALLEEDTRAVWCIRGGYGTTRLLPQLDLRGLRRSPKVLIGFSDITALLLSLSVPGGYVTFHGPVVTQLGQVPRATLDWLCKLVCAPRPAGRVPLGRLRTLVGGVVHGFLLGGNLATLCALAGTPFLPPTAGAILCIEDTAEQAYRLDRMACQLRQAGVLQHVLGVVVGSLAGCKPAGRSRHAARSVLERSVASLGVPAVSGADFGHQPRNQAWPQGVLARLDASRGSLTILEPAVC